MFRKTSAFISSREDIRQQNNDDDIATHRVNLPHELNSNHLRAANSASGQYAENETRASTPAEAREIAVTPSHAKRANIIFLSLGFMFTISATWTSSIIIESVIQPLKPPGGSFVGNEGYLSISITYLVQIFSPLYSIIAMEMFGLKLALMLAGLQSLFYCAVFLFYPVPWLVYVASVFLGIGQGVAYTLFGVVLTANSTTSHDTTRNVGLFWTIFSFSIWGDIYASYKFHDVEEIDAEARRSVYAFLCVLALCGVLMFGLVRAPPTHGQQITTADNDDSGERKKVQVFNLNPVDHNVAVVVTAPAEENYAQTKIQCARDGNLHARESNSEERRSARNVPTQISRTNALPRTNNKLNRLLNELVLAPLSTLRQRETVLLLGTMAYCAIQFGFYSAAFPAAVGFTQQFGTRAKSLMSLASLMLGIGNIVAGACVSHLSKFVDKFGGRLTFMIAALAAHVTAYALTFITLPYYSPLGPTDAEPLVGPYPAAILIAGFLLGAGDGLCSTQLIAAMSEVYGRLSEGDAANQVDERERLTSEENASSSSTTTTGSRTRFDFPADMPAVASSSTTTAKDVVPAFALANAIQCLIVSVVTAYSAVLPLPWHFVINIPIAVVGVSTYVYVDRHVMRRNNNHIHASKLKRQQTAESSL